MDRVKKRSLCLAILLGALLMTPAPQAWAQANDLPEGWEIQLEPMWMWVKGFDEHVGDVVRSTDVFIPDIGDPDVILDTEKREPINLEMDSNFTGRVELTFRRNQWGFGVSSWFFITDDDVSGLVTSPPPIITGESETFFANTVSMWGETLFPVTNDLEPSGFSPISFFADAELNTFTFDLYGLRTLAEKPASRIDLLAGVKVGWLDMEVNQGFTERAFVLDFFESGVHLNNFISLRSAADADFLGVGPMVGFAGDATWERFRVKAFITQSILAGEADWDGVFTDIDNISSTTNSDGGGPFTPDFFIRTDIPFSKEETVFIPVTEAQIKVKYEITENIALGLAGFASIWHDAPAPPTFNITHVPAEIGVGPGLDWELEERTLVFMGVGLDIEIMWP